MKSNYIPPSFKLDAFHCPHCGTFAHQSWHDAHYFAGFSRYLNIEGLTVSFCSRCQRYALWIYDEIIYPVSSTAPLPSENMPEDVKEDFAEARNIVNNSPRAAAALLRLSLQKLMVHLGEKGKDLNKDIANLVKEGLPEKIQKALDSVRVIGNNAVHPGQIDLRDDSKTAHTLFDLLNMIVEVMITQPRRVDEIYKKIKHSIKLEYIEKAKSIY